MSAFFAVYARDVALSIRAGGGALLSVVFFALCVLVFAFAIGPDGALLGRIAIPVIWASALLSTLVSLDRVFHADYEDGSLDILVEASESLTLMVLAKAAAHWTYACLPLIIASPVLGVMVSLPGGAAGALVVSLIVGTPALSLIGTLVAALTVSMRRAGVLMSILATPLFLPALIFGVSAALEPVSGGGAALMLLCAVSLCALIITPLAGAAAIRSSMG